MGGFARHHTIDRAEQVWPDGSDDLREFRIVGQRQVRNMNAADVVGDPVGRIASVSG
jgi:hypothetical protein